MKDSIRKAFGKDYVAIYLALLVAGIALLILQEKVSDEGVALAFWGAGIVCLAMFILYPLIVIWVKSIGMPPFPVDEKRLRG
jgi:hypothetical protein